MNKELYDKIYDLILKNDPQCIKMSNNVDAGITAIIKSYAGRINEKELEELSDKFVDILSIGMNEAYKIGAKHCLKLIFEIIAD